MINCKSVATSLPNKLNYTSLNSEKYYTAALQPVKILIGSLMYVILYTRPDKSSAMKILSRYHVKNNKGMGKS